MADKIARAKAVARRLRHGEVEFVKNAKSGREFALITEKDLIALTDGVLELAAALLEEQALTADWQANAFSDGTNSNTKTMLSCERRAEQLRAKAKKLRDHA